MSTRDLRDRLTRRAAAAGLTLHDQLATGLEAYYRLLTKWNAKVNLTAFHLTAAGEDGAVDRLIIEPLVAAGHLPGWASTLLDIGSGGGSPAIPMKLARPDLTLRMVEVKTRKAVFLREAIRTLGIHGAEVETARFEELLARPALHESQDVVSIRAVKVDLATLSMVQAFLRPGGQVFLFRAGGGPELTDIAPPPLRWFATYPLVHSIGSRLVVLGKSNS